MTDGQNYLVFGDDWGVYPNTTEHVLCRLVRQSPTLWVHLMGMRAPEWNLYNLRRAGQKLSQWTRRTRTQPPARGMAVYSPFVLPLPPNGLTRWWNRRAATAGIRRRLAQAGMAQPIFFTSFPNAAELLGEFGEKLVVYLCEDEYAEMPRVYRAYVREMEERLLERADLVFVTSRALREAKSRPGAPAILLPQGVDFDHFHSARTQRAAAPAEFDGLPRPIIGFVGLLASWVNLEWISAVARAFPQASVVLIGPERTDTGVLRALRNVHLFGPRAYRDLPAFLAHFDVGLIPFRQCELTRYVNPLKLLEYMAAGLPVVSTPLPDVQAWGDLVFCADTVDAFVTQVADALRSRSPEQEQRRIHTARRNSWESRAEDVRRHLAQRLAGPCCAATQVLAGGAA